jgi:chorismate dehydratase
MRIGAVSYLNALPLWKPLEQLSQAQIAREVPSRLQQLLQNCEVEAALLPVIDWIRHGGHAISDAGICADGEVRSVLVFSEKEPREWRTLGADTSSHTSVALTQVLARDLWQCAPEIIAHPPDFDAMRARFDAWLLIGDAALEARASCPPDVRIFDLAQQWRELTGLPFVFATWVAREDLSECEREELGDLLSLARDKGEKQIPLLAREASSPLPKEEIESYLCEAIGYRITPRHREAMEEFRLRCATIEAPNGTPHTT